MNWLIQLLGSVFGEWLRQVLAQREAEQKGALEQAAKERKVDDANLDRARRARESIDPVDRRMPDDPDFRD